MYQLIYWPFLPGRGEFVRLVLAAADVAWEDLALAAADARQGAALVLDARKGGLGTPAFAPPMLRHGDFVLSQTAAICDWVAARHELAGSDAQQRARALQLQLTVQDVVSAAHDTHHPLSVGQYYEDQRDAAMVAAKAFRDARIPAFYGHFETVLAETGTGFLVGGELTHADLALFQLLAGLAFAFPRAHARHLSECPLLATHHLAIQRSAPIAAYLASDRRMAFNEHGIFRRYPELDDAG